ncbi:GntR family transcriptional regulator [Georgenia sp. AZ-5]|uniref:GntR family transcriptional regulator n=1 Tax=Georgenia sp. AZ-5 TaxID=3367526 RepID=UPI003754084F
MVPEYRRIRETLRAQLEAGEWQPGQRIPTERELMERFGVASMTVRHAVDGLVRQGLLVRRRGSGTFVAKNRAVSRSIDRLRGFTEDVDGATAGARVVVQRETDPDEDVAELLELPNGARVVELVRVRTIDGRPVSLNQVWVPVRVAPGLASADMNDASLYEYLATTGVELQRAEQKILAVAATEWHARLLGVAEGTPLLASERLTRATANVPVEFARSWSRPELPVWVEMRR